MSNLLNISSLSNPSLINSAKGQLPSRLPNNIKTTSIGKTGELKIKIEELTKKRANVEKDYNLKNKKLQEDYKANIITQEEEQQLYNQYQQQRTNELKLIDDEIEKTKKELTTLNKDPLEKNKAEKKKINSLIDKNIKSSKRNYRKANLARNRQVLQNVKKNIGTIALSKITSILVNVSSQTSNIQELVNKTNDIIDKASTPQEIQQAIVARNSAIQIINNQERKLKLVRTLIKILKVIIIVCEVTIIVLTILYTIPAPFGLGPIMPSPIKKIIDKLNKLIEILNIAIPIISSIIDQTLAELEDYKSQLHDINNTLDNKASDLSNNQFNSIEGGGKIKVGLLPGEYRGFKFAIREETGPNALIVRGNKRHYAVAINKQNVEVVKSDYSFTLDPNDLVEQLKLIIDTQILQD